MGGCFNQWSHKGQGSVFLFTQKENTNSCMQIVGLKVTLISTHFIKKIPLVFADIFFFSRIKINM